MDCWVYGYRLGVFVKFIWRNVRLFWVGNSSENKYPKQYGDLKKKNHYVYGKSEAGGSRGWGIQQLHHTTRSRPYSYSAILSMTTLTPLVLKMTTPLQASHLYTPTPEAENAAACVLCVFVTEIFPGSASRIFSLLYHILPFTTWLPIYPKTHH